MTCRSLAFKRNLGTGSLLISSEYEFVNQNRPVGQLAQQVDQMQPRVLFNDNFPRSLLLSFFLYKLRVCVQQIFYSADAYTQECLGFIYINTRYTSCSQIIDSYIVLILMNVVPLRLERPIYIIRKVRSIEIVIIYSVSVVNSVLYI